MTKFLDLVPSWIYTVAIVLMSALCGFLAVERADALTEAAKAQRQASDARADLATVKANAASAAASALQEGRAKERELTANQTKATDELQTVIASRNARITDLERRMRQLATTPNANRGGEYGSQGAGTTASGDGAGIPGFRGLADGDPVVIDSQGQNQLAALAVSANDARATLKACRVLLRQAWRSTN